MKKLWATLSIATFLLLAACANGSDNADTNDVETPVATSPTAVVAGATISVKSARTELGTVLAGANGMTLYGFTNDVKGQSECFGTCAEAWPPVLVGPDWTVGPELDSGVFSSVDRGDGTTQLVAGKWPLYYYSGDTSPGDVNGQASGNVWFVVGTDALLVREAPAKGTSARDDGGADNVQLASTSFGDVLVDSEGRSLYAFESDVDGTPTCADACADAWPAAVVDGKLTVAEDLDESLFAAVPALEGGQQLKVGVWPLYRFAGDAAPGDVNGQGSGGVWFLVDGDGKLVKQP